jgi:hypothetical protein
MSNELSSDKAMYVAAGLFVFFILCLALTTYGKQLSRDQHFESCIKKYTAAECIPLLKD